MPRAATPAKKVTDTVSRASGSARRAKPDKVLHGPYDIAIEGEVVGSVAIVERPRRNGEPAIVPQQRDAAGTPVQTDILGVRTLAVEMFGATV